MDISLVTWNIWKGVHLPKVIQKLQELKSDIICLQEIIEQEDRSRKRVNSAHEIAKALNYNYIYCKSFTTDRHTPVFDLGDAILSKFPIINSTCHTLSSMHDYKGSSVTEPRNAIEVEVAIEGTKLTLITTHLGYSEGFTESDIRTQQTEKLLQLLTKEKTVLAGDFNSLPHSPVITKISQILENTDPEMSKPTYTAMKDQNHKQDRIDYIFTSKDIKKKSFEILESDASDHFPVKALVTI
jgi:endonuclease/exonuclease/phosphatase family metal-dependent hydrolase